MMTRNKDKSQATKESQQPEIVAELNSHGVLGSKLHLLPLPSSYDLQNILIRYRLGIVVESIRRRGSITESRCSKPHSVNQEGRRNGE
jgi:hypothetical protein